MAENKTLEHLPEVRAAVAALSPEDRELLMAVQASPFKLTAPERFKEFAANIDYFVFEPNIHDLNDLGWRYLAQHMDTPLPPELLKAIDPVPPAWHTCQKEQGRLLSEVPGAAAYPCAVPDTATPDHSNRGYLAQIRNSRCCPQTP